MNCSLFINSSSDTKFSDEKMFNRENSFMEEEKEDQKLIPLPEIVKDFALVMLTLALLFFLTIGILGYWRRRIVQEDSMTTEFKQLMDRGNSLAKRE